MQYCTRCCRNDNFIDATTTDRMDAGESNWNDECRSRIVDTPAGSCSNAEYLTVPRTTASRVISV